MPALHMTVNDDRWNLKIPGIVLSGCDEVNVIVGKNGCGKSTLLRNLERNQVANSEIWGRILYVTPERGGVLSYSPGIEQSMENLDWFRDVRRNNQFSQYREQTVSTFRRLEISLYRQYEDLEQIARVDDDFEPINSLLDNVEFRRNGNAFSTHSLIDGNAIPSNLLSSGEAELITLTIDCLNFSIEADERKRNLLLLDEPDVHLHPDLQVRFIEALLSLISKKDIQVVIATHSTAILGALANKSNCRVAFMRSGSNSLNFLKIDDAIRQVLPVFGAHPLSNIFNQSPILLVEGEDDVRIWQQAVRTSCGLLKAYPVSCDSISQMSSMEAIVSEIASSVYDSPKAFSLRDHDDTEGDSPLGDLGPVRRFRLNCREAENLLLCDEVLTEFGISWDTAKLRLKTWLETNSNHRYASDVENFLKSDCDRKGFKIKSIRTILVADVLETEKPWEVVVGQTIGRLLLREATLINSQDSILQYLGESFCKEMMPAF
jgi:energy-coupling factor transporter ATP-binding protein EcfA2